MGHLNAAEHVSSVTQQRFSESQKLIKQERRQSAELTRLVALIQPI